MHGRPGPDPDALPALLDADPGQTLDRLLARCWPTGGERTDGVRRGWLASWGAGRAVAAAAAAPGYGCARVGCAACN